MSVSSIGPSNGTAYIPSQAGAAAERKTEVPAGPQDVMEIS